MHRQAGVGRGHKRLIKRAAGRERTERVHEHGLAGGGQARGDAHCVRFRDTGIVYIVRKFLGQLAHVAAALKVAVNMYDRLALCHQVMYRSDICVTHCTGILLVLANQSKAHLHPLPYCALTAAYAASEALIASSHCSGVGCEECAPDGSANVAPLPLTVFKTIQVGLPFTSYASCTAS